MFVYLRCKCYFIIKEFHNRKRSTYRFVYKTLPCWRTKTSSYRPLSQLTSLTNVVSLASFHNVDHYHRKNVISNNALKSFDAVSTFSFIKLRGLLLGASADVYSWQTFSSKDEQTGEKEWEREEKERQEQNIFPSANVQCLLDKKTWRFLENNVGTFLQFTWHMKIV